LNPQISMRLIFIAPPVANRIGPVAYLSEKFFA
jgi:hypothetical protein